MPDTFGKRQRQNVKARKAAAKEERRIARNKRQAEIAAGTVEPDSWLGTTNQTILDELSREETRD